MRTIILTLATALTLSPMASARAATTAGDGHNHGGHGHGNHGGGGGGGGGGNGPEARLTGAGQRLHFSFGGDIRLRNNKARGKFVLVVHPLAPQGTTVVVACKFSKFSNASITGATATFRGQGKCERLSTDGSLESFEAVNDFQIVNGETTDSIDVNFVGPTGVAVPGGTLDFGGFTLTPAPA